MPLMTNRRAAALPSPAAMAPRGESKLPKPPRYALPTAASAEAKRQMLQEYNYQARARRGASG